MKRIRLVATVALLVVTACQPERSRARPTRVTLTPDDDALAVVEWRLRYEDDRLESITREANDAFVSEHRFTYDDEGLVDSYTVEGLDGEVELAVKWEDGRIVEVDGADEVVDGNVTRKAELTITARYGDDGRMERMETQTFFSSVDATIPFLPVSSSLATDETLNYSFNDDGRLELIEGDREETAVAGLGDATTTTVTTIDVAVELRYTDDGTLDRVTRTDERKTGDTVSESETDARYEVEDGRIAAIASTVSAGGNDTDTDWELEYDDEGRVIELKNDDQVIELEYDVDPLEGPTVALPLVLFGDLFDLEGRTHTLDVRLDHRPLP